MFKHQILLYEYVVNVQFHAASHYIVHFILLLIYEQLVELEIYKCFFLFFLTIIYYVPAGILMTYSLPINPEMIVDRPFLFQIVKSTTNTDPVAIFQGKINEPLS